MTLPLSLVDWGLRVGAQYSPEITGFDVQALAEASQETPDDKIFDVQDEEDGEHVEILVEFPRFWGVGVRTHAHTPKSRVSLR